MKTQIDSKNLWFENIGDKTIYYSYNTTVAVKTPIDTYVCEKMFGQLLQLDTLTELRN